MYPEEVEYLLRGFEDSIPLYAGGLYIAGENLDVTKINDQSIYAQKVRHSNEDTNAELTRCHIRERRVFVR